MRSLPHFTLHRFGDPDRGPAISGSVRIVAYTELGHRFADQSRLVGQRFELAPKGGPATGRETVFPSIGPAELAVDGPNREEATPGPFFSFLKYTGMNRD